VQSKAPPSTHVFDSGPSLDPSTVVGFRVAVVDGAPATSWQSTSARCAIGSHEGNDLVVADQTVSRFHCEITMDAAVGPRIRDLGSKNGTVVDGVRVVDAFLRSGSTMKLGAVTLRFDFVGHVSKIPISERTSFHGLVAESVAMRMALALIERAASSDMTVLLEGETGTGKSRVAEAIHRAGARASKPFLVVDCGAIPANLLESELFGHERNAFTGAGERRIGAFEEAHGGTIFLDEIGELPLDLQPKLLRALEAREIRRLGSNHWQKIDVRIVAATNRDLRTEVNEGRFRSDLYFRLAVLRIELPPLRARLEDLPALAKGLLASIGAKQPEIDALFTPDFLASLRRGAWAGNIRELRNHLERCLVFQEALPIGELAASPSGQSATSSAPTVDAREPYAVARRRAIEEFERVYVRELLALHDSKMTPAATAAGVGRVYLYKLARRHGLRPT
jgi:two-component system, NtrC family, response regulator GlrR